MSETREELVKEFEEVWKEHWKESECKGPESVSYWEARTLFLKAKEQDK